MALAISASLAGAPHVQAQISAEYRDRTEAATAAAWPKQAVRATHGMVASDEELGSQAGVEIMKRGGNAVDAAVAVAFALAVVEPAAGNIGGGGFMLVRLADGRSSFFDYREVAPGHATSDMYIKGDGKLDAGAATVGPRSVAVPGTVAGLALALKTYGTMKLADVMAPAIRLAEDGFPVSVKLAHQLEQNRTDLQKFSTSNRIFLRDGRLWQAGDVFKQPELAATLRRIAKNGPEEFYRGETARAIAADMNAFGGIVTLEDLAAYQPKVRQALRAKYENEEHAWEVLTSPPPSSGGVAIIEALNMLEHVPLKNWDDVNSVHMTVEVMRRVFADRAAYLADPDYASIPVDGLIAPCYAAERAATIDPAHASSSKEVKAGIPHVCGMAASAAAPELVSGLSEGPHTTHFSVVDAQGNAVASTYTLNNSYGSHFTCSAGFLLNDEMDDFTAQPGAPNALFGLMQSEANAIAPGTPAAQLDGADHAAARREAQLCDRLARRPHDHFRDAAQRAELDAARHGRAGRHRRAALSSPVAAGCGDSGERVSRQLGNRAEYTRSRDEAARAYRFGERHRHRPANRGAARGRRSARPRLGDRFLTRETAANCGAWRDTSGSVARFTESHHTIYSQAIGLDALALNS
jgi:gamma-glutamyltranspeptidase/glutathione hydrolase